MKSKMTVNALFIFLMLAFLLVKTDIVMEAATGALKLCVTAVIPTLFPFFVVSGLLVNSGLVSVLGKLLSPISRMLFKTSGKGAVVFVMGILCGYPTGAKVIADLCNDGFMTRKDGERLLGFCNNSGPLFVIGAVGNGMLGNHNLGVILYIIHAVSAILTGIAFRSFAQENYIKEHNEIVASSIGETVAKSVETAVKSILNVCGYVLFFGVLCSFFDNVFITSLLEVTTGAKELVASAYSPRLMLVLLSGVIGFGGICVVFQVQSAVNAAGLSVKPYIIGKTVQAIISMVLTFVYVNLSGVVCVFAPYNAPKEVPNLMILLFLSGVFYTLLRLTKKSSCGIFSLNEIKERQDV